MEFSMKKLLLFGVFAGLLTFLNTGGAAMALELKSTSFENNSVIPAEFTCEGKDVSPDLQWSDAPDDTKSFALICDDPDAYGVAWVHWVIYNIAADKNSLPKGVQQGQSLPDGSNQGINDSQEYGYGGPCPPPGKPHRYVFKLYALDDTLLIGEKVTKDKLLNAIKSHVLAEAQLIGTYKR
ncbi:MAG TPA: YbhB/YbcL family Raf kinase inhibitor-like protein [Candidatus Omnitrophota bacterium]|nr:YbhB/YbcL family Raf kinase inhibitor-like protein [Candidatus Omnitrophota bacterium]